MKQWFSSSVYNQIKIIVVGGLNTDIIASGVKRFLDKGEVIISGNLLISAGGKSRNIAQMVSFFLGKNKTAMIGRTSKDPFGLWKIYNYRRGKEVYKTGRIGL